MTLTTDKACRPVVGQHWYFKARPGAVWTNPKPTRVEAVLDGGWVVARFEDCAPMIYDARSFARYFELRPDRNKGR